MTGDEGASIAAAATLPARHGFLDYGRVLKQHQNFRYLWIAETIDNVGSWLVSAGWWIAYIAAAESYY
jgi:hypothetical protein